MRAALVGSLLAVAATTATLPAAADGTGRAPDDLVEVLVRPTSTVAAVAHDVVRLGGRVEAVLTAVGMVEARVPASALAALAADPDVASVSANGRVTFAGASHEAADEGRSGTADQPGKAEKGDKGEKADKDEKGGKAQKADKAQKAEPGGAGKPDEPEKPDTPGKVEEVEEAGEAGEAGEADQDPTLASDEESAETSPGTTLDLVNRTIGATDLHGQGIDGRGIDIALVDTGVGNVAALAGQWVSGIDLSFDAADPAFAGRDGYGHGTHLAGIMVGNGAGLTGVAPGARIVDVRVGDRQGTASVSQVVAAIDWVIQNARTGGRNIRVLNLAFGGPEVTRGPDLGPLVAAVEAAGANGIVVVVSAGNDGPGSTSLASPATAPGALAVGASTTQGTPDRADDAMAEFSQRGDAHRSPDLVAPGRSILSVVPEDSWVARTHPEAHRDGLFLGSGTSQAGAVTSAAVALLLQARPTLTPDDVKTALTSTADSLVKGDRLDGAGLLDVAAANLAGTAGGAGHPAGDVPAGVATGTGWAGANWNGANWNGANWNGANWNGANWNGANWNGANWNGANWNGANWNGADWAGADWDGSTWNGANWNGASWSGANWNGANWNAFVWGT